MAEKTIDQLEYIALPEDLSTVRVPININGQTVRINAGDLTNRLNTLFADKNLNNLSADGSKKIDENFIYGFIPSTNVTNPDECINITAGVARCKDLSTFVELAEDITELSMPDLLGSALANSTTYYLYRYKKNDDTDQWHLSTSLTTTIADIKSANAYRRVFSFKTDSDGDIVQFKGEELNGGAIRTAYNNTDGGGNTAFIANYDIGYISQAYFDYTNINLNNPSIRVKLELTCYVDSGAPVGSSGLVFKDNITGETKSTCYCNSGYGNTGSLDIHCDSNGQIKLKHIAISNVSDIVQIKCVAYVDYRIND